MPGRVVSVNLAEIRVLGLRGRPVETGIWKLPVADRVEVWAEGLVGDRQADRRVHGGPDQAVYAYAAEDYAWWEEQLGRSLGPGTFGENLTVEGVEVSDALVGEQWAIGTTVLEVSAPRIPCWKLGVRMDDPRFVKRFAKARRPGSYLRVLRGGTVAAGDEVTVVARPDHDVSVRMIATAYLEDHSLAAAVLAAPRLPDSWRRWAQEHLSRSA